MGVDVKPKKMVDEPVAPGTFVQCPTHTETNPGSISASQSTIKKERVSKTGTYPTPLHSPSHTNTTSLEQLRNPALANSSSDDKESESFLVTISHPHSGKEVRCKVRGRNAIKKVVDGACKGLRLDAHRCVLLI